MAVHHSPAALAAKATIVPAPGRNRGERAFELHPAVRLLTMGAYLSFVLILSATFMGPDLVVGAGIIVVPVIALFLVPA